MFDVFPCSIVMLSCDLLPTRRVSAPPSLSKAVFDDQRWLPFLGLLNAVGDNRSVPWITCALLRSAGCSDGQACPCSNAGKLYWDSQFKESLPELVRSCAHAVRTCQKSLETDVHCCRCHLSALVQQSKKPNAYTGSTAKSN